MFAEFRDEEVLPTAAEPPQSVLVIFMRRRVARALSTRCEPAASPVTKIERNRVRLRLDRARSRRRLRSRMQALILPQPRRAKSFFIDKHFPYRHRPVAVLPAPVLANFLRRDARTADPPPLLPLKQHPVLWR